MAKNKKTNSTHENQIQTNVNGGGKILCISLILNVLFVAVLGAYAYRKRDRICEILHISMSDAPSESVLSTFNNEPLEVLNEEIKVGSDTTITMLFLGNSLTRHGKCAYWDHVSGMAATSADKDFVHLVAKMTSQARHANVRFSVCNIADFERGFHTFPFDWDKKLANATVKQPDYLILQIGENVSQQDFDKYRDEYRRKYTALLSHFPNSVRIITTPFWLKPDFNYLYTDIALQTHSHLIDLSHLSQDKSGINLASSQKDYKQPGVGDHPGDLGMQNIAKVIMTEINK